MSDFIFAIKILGVVVIGLIVILALFNSLKKHDRAILRKRILTGLIDFILLPILSICFGTSIIACIEQIFQKNTEFAALAALGSIASITAFILLMHKSDDIKKNNSTQSSSQEETTSQSQSFIERKRRKEIVFYSNRDKYSATLSIIALFSWIIRRDGRIDKQEIKTAQLYLHAHPVFDDILKQEYTEGLFDPIMNIKHYTSLNCDRLLNMYNTYPTLLMYRHCCKNILSTGIYYEALIDLIRALFQVANSSDGIIDTERIILSEIAKELKLKDEDWQTISRRFSNPEKEREAYNRTNSHDSSSDSDQHRSSDQKEKGPQGEKEKKRMRSSTYGYKLTQAYNQLGLLSTASDTEIKAAFRLLANKYHPDHLSPDATDMDRKISADQFRLVKEAYDYIRLERGM